MSNPFSSAAIRREFPRGRLPNIITPNGGLSLVAIKQHLSARGTPDACPKVVAALVKDGGLEPGYALAIAGLVENAKTLNVCTWEDRMAGLTHALKRHHAQKFPKGKYAHELGLVKAEG